MTHTLIPGAEAWSHVGDGDRGALVIHGFTSNPASMRGVAEAFAAAGYHVELPRLPGHGTTVEDMLTTDWSDWSSAAEASYQTLLARCRSVVVVGLSMGGSLTLWLAGHHADLAGIICINPLTQPFPEEMLAVLDGMLAAGDTMLPGIGGSIADPNAQESAYEGTPVPCALSLMRDGVAVLEPTYASLRMPMLLLNSPQDNVIEPAQAEYLATHYGGPLERITLERSYHVATQDYDKELIFSESVAFADRATAMSAS